MSSQRFTRFETTVCNAGSWLEQPCSGHCWSNREWSRTRWIIYRTNYEKHPGRLERTTEAFRFPGTVTNRTSAAGEILPPFLFLSFEKMGFRGILYRGDKDETRRKMCICLRSLLWCLSGISRWVPWLFVWFCPGCLQGVQKRFSEMCGRTSNHPLQRMSGISLRKIKKIQSGTNYWRHLQSRWCNSGFTIHKKSRRWAISALSGRKIHLQSMRRTSDLV